MTDTADLPAAGQVAHALPSHIILLVEWAAHPSGRVLAADADLLGQLDVEGVKYREATDFERRIAGFID
jgi:hypothetical protein